MLTYSVVDIGTATDNSAVIDNAHLAMHIQFLLDDIGLFVFQVAFPGLVDHLAAIQHSDMSHRVLAGLAIHLLALLNLLLELLQLLHLFLLLARVGVVALLVLVALFTDRWVHTLAHDRLGNTSLDILVVHVCLGLEFFQCGRLVDSVVRAQREDEDLF